MHITYSYLRQSNLVPLELALEIQIRHKTQYLKPEISHIHNGLKSRCFLFTYFLTYSFLFFGKKIPDHRQSISVIFDAHHSRHQNFLIFFFFMILHLRNCSKK